MVWQLKLLSITSSHKQLLHWLKKAGTDKEDGLCTANNPCAGVCLFVCYFCFLDRVLQSKMKNVVK